MRTTEPKISRYTFRLISLLLLLSFFTCNKTTVLATTTPPAWPSVRADSAIVIDFDTGEVLFEKNADTMRVPASMTKVMTAYIIFEELESGGLTLSTMVPISEKNAQISRDPVNYPASVPLPAGSSISVETLLGLIFLPSASASCIVMAEHISGTEDVFVQRMNETAKRLGMQAEYKNCHGAHDHYISARSQAMLVRDFIKRFPQVLKYTSMTSMTFNGNTYANTNQLLPGNSFFCEGADGFKTGTTKAAGYCLSATATRNNHRIISVVMHSDNNTTRHTDSQTLLDFGFQVLETRSIFPDITYHWSRDAVESLIQKNVDLHTKQGDPFYPDQAITRAEFTAMLYSALENNGLLPAPPAEQGSSVTTETTTNSSKAKESFSDTRNHWAESYITKATELGIVSGVGDGLFSPDTPMTRQEMMVLIDRFLKLPDQNGLGFSDDGDIAFWALASAARVTAADLFSGNELNCLLPAKSTTRAEAATTTLRLLNLSK